MIALSGVTIFLDFHADEDGFKSEILSSYGCDASILIVFDLYNTSLNSPQLGYASYQQIWDIYLLERIAFLGEYHRYYTGQDTAQSAFLIKVGEWKAFITEEGAIPEWVSEQIIDYCHNLSQKVESKNAWSHYLEIELPFSLSLARLTAHGVSIDSEKSNFLLASGPTARNKLVNRLRQEGISSPTQEGLRLWLKQSDRPELQRLAYSGHDINFKSNESLDPIFVLFKRLDKLERGYRLVSNLSSGQKTVYPSYRTMGAETARCTCRTPNVMGIPKELRPLVIPHKKNWGIVEIDYCQMEVGVAAALSNDYQLISDFNSGDVYLKLASYLKVERKLAKQVFLALIYGVGISTLTNWMGSTNNSATRDVMNRFFIRYPRLRSYLKSLVQQGKENGCVSTVTGLKRTVGEAVVGGLSPERLYEWEVNWFKNYPIQGSSAAIFKRSIINIAKKEAEKDFRLLVPMYDSIVFEAPLHELHSHVDIVSEAMCSAMQFYFPSLKPRVDVNMQQVKSWNSEDVTVDFARFLASPLDGIKPFELPTDDWSQFL